MASISQNTAAEINQKAEEHGETFAEIGVTKSQLRNIYGAVRRARNELEYEDDGSVEQARSSLQLLKPKLAYAAARDDEMEQVKQSVLDLMDEFNVFDGDDEQLAAFFETMEGIVAYHAYYHEEG